MLSDYTINQCLINGRIVITPSPKNHQLQPASVDLTFGNQVMSPYSDIKTKVDSVYTILPGECVLATTRERVELADDIAGRVEGKSTWGRRFILIHTTAGFIDPGFKGQITLELTNLSKVSWVIKVGEPIAQISFHFTDRPVSRPYGHPSLKSHYQNQIGVQPAFSE